jgi:hypothetical protein
VCDFVIESSVVRKDVSKLENEVEGFVFCDWRFELRGSYFAFSWMRLAQPRCLNIGRVSILHEKSPCWVLELNFSFTQTRRRCRRTEINSNAYTMYIHFPFVRVLYSRLILL